MFENFAFASWKSAKSRSSFSHAAALCNRKGLIKGNCILDYGCGRGGDVLHWQKQGYAAYGYDPYWFPVLPPQQMKYDTVTLFYVLNVIPDVEERIDVLRSAWSFGDRLIVAALIGAFTSISSDRYFIRFETRDLKRLIIFALRKMPCFVATGIYYIDRDFPDVCIYSWQEAVSEIDALRLNRPIAADGDYISRDRGSIIYHRSNGTRFRIKPSELDKYHRAIEIRDKIRLIQLCTF